MDYKEKYEQALERAREIIKDYENRGLKDILFYAKEDFEAIFPELKESEDEKIIKELITHCRNTRCVTEEGAERIAKWIAWLEKQSENEKGERKKDDAYSEFAISAVEDYYGGDNPLRKEIVDWLKSLKQRIKGE